MDGADKPLNPSRLPMPRGSYDVSAGRMMAIVVNTAITHAIVEVTSTDFLLLTVLTYSNILLNGK